MAGAPGLLGLLMDFDARPAVLNPLEKVFSDPRVQHLGMRQHVPLSRVGKVGLVRGGLRISDTPAAIRSAAPELGAHTDEILSFDA